MSAQSSAIAAVTSGFPELVNARYLVVGTSDPGLLPRLLEPMAKLGEVPTRVHASRESGDGSELSVDVRLGGVSSRTAELVENSLRRVFGVRQVIAVVERPS